ncbi:MAG TPA: peptidyl-dipeptidase Dcp [Rhodanobacteraceae bacterium]|nr:peptidyl-dipeptidase Dcp [Rhodanobacteraceae bacterium]
MSPFRIKPLALACCVLFAGTAGLSACSQSADANPGATPASASTTPAHAASAAVASAASAATPAGDIQSNPFYHASTLPFQAPDFSKIKDSDYQPAMEEGMRKQLAELEAIANDSAPPTFDNTIIAMEKSGQMLNRVMLTFSTVAGANTDDTLQKVQEIEAPKLSAHQDAIYLNPKLFARIQTLYNQRDSLKLDPESEHLLEWDYKEFTLNGAKLSDADKAQLKHMNEQEATLSAQFQNKLLAAAKAGALVVSDKSKLSGLSDDAIAAAASAAKDRKLEGEWVIPLQNTTQQPALASLTDRDTRHELFEHSWMRAEKGDANDTRDTIAQIAKIRADKARLLGFDTYAAWKLQDQMAKTPAAVMSFLDKLVPAEVARAKFEAADIQKVIDADQAKAGKPTFTLQPWDWELYAEQVRKQKYDLDEDQIKPYFELNDVLQNGVFYAANQLYGLTFKERKDLPVWQPDVRVFEVFDKDGSPLALFYCDYFKRDNKSGGAWMSNMVNESTLLGTKPVIYNVANFTKPAPGQPALLSFDDVITMFHEFGHALNGMFADTKYPSLSGANTARDFVEFPSQFNEHWALDPKVFANYAKNYKTGQPMPQALVDKIKNSQLFNKGYDMTEATAASLLDMSWHTLPASAPKVSDVDAFEAKSLQDNHVDLSYVPPRYRSSYFLHIWGNGYAAGYYAYNWTMMLADDAFAWFDEHGGLTRANGDRFRDMVLSRGNTEDLATMYKNWRGRDPNIDAMKKDRGLEPAANSKPTPHASDASVQKKSGGG